MPGTGEKGVNETYKYASFEEERQTVVKGVKYIVVQMQLLSTCVPE